MAPLASQSVPPKVAQPPTMPLVPVGPAEKVKVPPVTVERSRVAPAERVPREAKVSAAEPPEAATDWTRP